MLKGIGKLLGRPLIKDIDIIVAEEFLSKKKKRIAEKLPEEPEEVPLELEDEIVLPEPLFKEALAAADTPNEVHDTKALDRDISCLMKKKIPPMNF